MNNSESLFEQCYRCYPVSFIDKDHLEAGDKIIMPPSALDRLASVQIEYPMLFELSDISGKRITHCGVLEFVADEGLVYLPYWMMQNMDLQEGGLVKVKNASLVKGNYIKLQPHTQDFLDISNPKAILETTLRTYSCLTTGDTIMVPYNNKKYYIDIVETKPSSAVSIIETDCEVDFAAPLDFKEPEKPKKSLTATKRPLEVEEEQEKKAPKFTPFAGPGRRLDGKPPVQPAAPISNQQEQTSVNGKEGPKRSESACRRSGKLVFGSNANPVPELQTKIDPKNKNQKNQEKPEKVEESKFEAFTGKKYTLNGGAEGSFGNDMEKKIGLLLLEKRRQEADELERELNLYRSGSAPPTVEGSLRAVSGLFGGGHSASAFPEVRRAENGNGFVSDEDLRSDPAYLSYYYANANLNPRLPPPLLSREDLRVAQRLKSGSTVLGGIGDRRKANQSNGINNGGNQSLFSMPPGFESRKCHEDVNSEKARDSADWGGDGLIGLSGLGLGSKQKSFAEIFQDDVHQIPSVSQHPSRSASRNAFDENVEATSDHVASGPQIVGSASSYSYAAALSRSTTPDPQAVNRAPSPCLTPIGSGRVNTSEKRNMNNPNSFSESSDLASALSGMNLSNNEGLEEDTQTGEDVDKHGNHRFVQQHGHSQTKEQAFLNESELLQKSAFSSSSSTHVNGTLPFAFIGRGGSSGSYQHLDAANPSFSNNGLNNYSMNPALASMMAEQLGTRNLPPLYENVAAAAALGLSGADYRVLGGGYSSPRQNTLKSGTFGWGESLQAPFADPMYLQYLKTSEYAAQLAALNNPSMDRAYFSNSYSNNLVDVQNAYAGARNSQYGYYGSPPTFGSGLLYPPSPLSSHAIPNSPMAPGSPMRGHELNRRFPSGPRNNISAGLTGPWQLDNGFGSSLLEEFKSNKTRCFELLVIAGHVVELSADQYGSRFIQQKLETATAEEKNMVYEEIMPEALVLMTDVFGNYVIQKFFEHGLPSQRHELAEKLLNNVLSLSLHMYGCRVIQKAVEVVDLDQKLKMVKELDGHVMRCVRDQNGNHVIQKCIECVPEENIQFIVSTFFDQVVTLSTHPYGCRVIQRILEHCEDPTTQNKVMEEILSHISMLAQDQYGNYVIQHVLEHGKPHEGSVIIKELAGKIVQMSQQKFASNVVEKCLTFGGPTERQLLFKEMLGSTDENEPLQAMMKDQFANYVVQKVLETCDDQQRELILSRIKVHLDALKRYTFGKHIVARVEKLVAAGERRMAEQLLNSSAAVA